MIIVSKRFVKIITVNFAGAIALYPFIFVKNKTQIQDAELMRHERIHLRQQIELLLVFFYLWYAIEYLVRLCQYRQHYAAYRNISFEREAYTCQSKENYLKNRPYAAFLKYICLLTS
ncbi:MAG: hypothetical protein R2798_10665 [Chitinophagales bacterium]|nr:hypothetical protein [Bacteroidota bacterium]MCB9044101.1 hypothetical protein [Chitinophagales bacterium]